MLQAERRCKPMWIAETLDDSSVRYESLGVIVQNIEEMCTNLRNRLVSPALTTAQGVREALEKDIDRIRDAHGRGRARTPVTLR